MVPERTKASGKGERGDLRTSERPKSNPVEDSRSILYRPYLPPGLFTVGGVATDRTSEKKKNQS